MLRTDFTTLISPSLLVEIARMICRWKALSMLFDLICNRLPKSDATLVSVPSITLDSGDIRVTVQDNRAEIKDQACLSARKEGEAIKTSN